MQLIRDLIYLCKWAIAGLLVLTLPIGAWFVYQHYAFRYYVSNGNSCIKDTTTNQYLMYDGQSYYNDGDYIYAYKKGLFLIIDNKIVSNTGTIIAYVDTVNDTSKQFLRINTEYYNGNIHLYQKNQLSSHQLDVYELLQQTHYPFVDQGF